jgi:predicted regulator of Ras-like GTPase activity (Roadblock/LC7/MglB family)
MTNLEDVLAGHWAQLPGCRVAAVVGMDGLLVERHPSVDVGVAFGSAPGGDELEYLAADLTTAFTLVGGELSKQLGSRIDEFVALGESGGYLARRVDANLFLFVVVGATADLGVVRRAVAGVCEQLAAEFA